MADTATVDPPVTASPVEETSEKPEPSQQPEPETRGQVEAPDSVAEPETLTKEEHEKLLKEALAKSEESARRKQENATKEAEAKARDETFNQRRQAAIRARAGAARNELADMVKGAYDAAEQGRPLAFDQQRFNRLIAGLDNMAFQEIHEEYSEEQDLLIEELYPEFAIPRDMSTALERAVKAYDKRAMVRARHEIERAALLSELTPKLRKQVLDELDVEDSETAKERSLRTAEKERTSAARPTNIAGGSAGNSRRYTTMLAVDTDYAAGKIDKQEMYRWLRRHEAGELPYS